MVIKEICLIFCCCLWFVSTAVAGALHLQAIVDHDLIGRDGTIQLSLRLEGSSEDFALDMSALKPSFFILYQGAGKRDGEWREKHFRITPKHAGVMHIPPLTAQFKNSAVRSQAVRVKVLARKGAVDNTRLWIKTAINRTQAWQGAPLRYQFIIFSTDQMVAPHLSVPKFTGFRVVVLEKGKKGRQIIRGRSVETKEFVYLLIPVRAGKRVIAGPHFTANVLQRVRARLHGADVHHPYAKIADGRAIAVNVRALPAKAQGLPVGKLALESTVSNIQTTLGEPVTWIVRVQADGMQANSLPDMAANMHLTDAFKVYPETPEITATHDHQGIRTTGIWRMTLLPQHQGKWPLPALSIPYFNPDTAQVEMAKTAALHVVVSAPLQKEDHTILSATVGAGDTRIVFRGVSEIWKYMSIALLILWVLTLMWVWIRQRGWRYRGRAASKRVLSCRKVLQAGDGYAQFTYLKSGFGLPDYFTPLALLASCPAFGSEAAQWLLALEAGRYANDHSMPSLNDRVCRQLINALHDQLMQVTVGESIHPDEFGRIWKQGV